MIQKSRKIDEVWERYEERDQSLECELTSIPCIFFNRELGPA